MKAWVAGVGAETARIEQVSPWKNGCVEACNGKLRGELLGGEVFSTLGDA